MKGDATREKIEISSVLLKKTKLDEESLRIGKMHNIVLSTLDGSIALDESETKNQEEENLKNAILNSQELMDSCMEIGLSVQNFELETSDDLTAKIISLFNSVVEEYASKTDDVAFIIGKYMEIIEDSSDLTDEQKASIKYGLATGLYSSNYWENRYNEVLK